MQVLNAHVFILVCSMYMRVYTDSFANNEEDPAPEFNQKFEQL